jgi:hypothetical protein
MNLRNIATDYALNRSWAVFPCHGVTDDGGCTCGNAECKSVGKHPATARGVKDATTDGRLIGMLFKDGLNIGCATGEPSGFWVLDIDGQAGESALAALEAEHGPLPATLTHYTGNGRHLLFTWPGKLVKNSVKRLGDGLDIRGDGGYIVIAPSKHASGTLYRFGNISTPIADAPEWLLREVLREDTPAVVPAAYDEPDTELSADDVRTMLDFIHPDCDYQTWVEIGMGLHAGGWPVQMWDDWSRAGAKYQNGDCYKRWKGFKPGAVTMGSVWHHAEQGGWSAAMLQPVVREGPHPAAAFLAKVRGPEKSENKPALTAFPFNPLDLTGTIGDTVRWIVGSAIKPQPELALMNTLAAMGAVFGRRYASPWDTRTNVYIVGLADTGSGKDHSRKQIKKLLVAAGLHDFLAGDSIVSGPGLLRGIEAHPAQILHLDELGMLLRGISDERAPAHAKQVSKNLTELYSTSGSVFHGGNYANKEIAPIIIDHPNLCIYGTSTLDAYAGALSRSAIASGELNRYIVIEGRTPTRQKPQHHKPGERLVADWSTFATHMAEGQGNLQAVGGKNVAAPVTTLVRWDDVEDRIDAIGHKEDRLVAEHKGAGLAGVWTRYLEQVIKLAMIAAIARNPVVPIIEAGDLDFGEAIVDWSNRFLCRLAREKIADSQAEREVNTVLDVLRQAGGAWVSKSDLGQRIRSIKSKDRESILADLVNVQGVVEMSVEKGERGPPAIKYRYCG